MRVSRSSNTRWLTWIVWLLLSGPFVLPACSSSSLNQNKTIGILQFTERLDAAVEGFKAGMTEEGYIEGQNITYLYRNAERDIDLLDSYTREMVNDGAELILAITTPAAVAAMEATRETDIPILFVMVSDPQSAGLVDSLTEPGGRITGVIDGGVQVAAKRLEILAQADPNIKRVLVVHSNTAALMQAIDDLRAVAPELGIELVLISVTSTEEAGAAYASIEPGEVDAVFVPSDSIVARADAALLQLVQRDCIPAIRGGGTDQASVLGYGPNITALGEQVAHMTAKVLSGILPANQPVETPCCFNLTVFLANAQKIGYEFNDEILQRADEIIR